MCLYVLCCVWAGEDGWMEREKQRQNYSMVHFFTIVKRLGSSLEDELQRTPFISVGSLSELSSKYSLIPLLKCCLSFSLLLLFLPSVWLGKLLFRCLHIIIFTIAHRSECKKSLKARTRWGNGIDEKIFHWILHPKGSYHIFLDLLR